MGAILFFALILFVMGGVTAYMGDRLGSYIGKKRHSSFGLRPRHTAMLWTVVSGGVIAVGTLALFVALNGTFKTALVRGPQLLESNRELTSRNRALVKRDAEAAKLAEADGALARAASAKADAASARAEAAQKTLAAVTGQLRASQNRLAASETRLTARQAALAAAEAHLTETQRGLGSARGDLKVAQSQVRAARAGVSDAKRQAQAAVLQVVQANKTVLALGIKQDTLQAAASRLTRENAAQGSLLQVSLGRALIFRRGEELGRTVVSARQPPDALRRELSVFLDQTETLARQRGAGGQDSAPPILIPALGEAASSGKAAAARDAALDALSSNIAAEGGFLPSIVVVASARYNTFRGESVTLEVRPYGNILIFPKDTVVARGTVDGSQPEDIVLKRLQSFLTDEVRTAALKRGIIPVHDAQSGAPLVGQPLGSAEWEGLVKQIQAAGPDAQITATVAENTYSADQLHLTFRVSGS